MVQLERVRPTEDAILAMVRSHYSHLSNVKACADCPFGSSKAQRHMRKSLRPGRFNEICQSVWLGGYFPCHKTTIFDDDDEYVPAPKEMECRGAIEFVARAAANREKAESRGRVRP
jgi:hypothetical protein